MGGRPPALTELQALKAREMYDEVDERGTRKYTVDQIAEIFSVSRKTIYRTLERSHRTAPPQP
ncbi:helix-turn-helix domain-containing protein [Nocardia asiatica]|uniref:helix-turn-helix domain-containing protein n=1 Tax=Nocardia asiatica TaxID=209252 RepID=UPI002453B8CD|nr:helix-turn-helix domain-containing protein [Nocardia asiatica]